LAGLKSRCSRDRFGFRDGDRGTHTSRTIMFAELQTLLAARPATSRRSEYVQAIIEDNVLAKRTGSTRGLSAQRLTELYGLDQGIPLFRAFRRFWDAATDGRPLLAFSCAYARDPLLRLTSPAVLPAGLGEPVHAADLETAVARAAPGRFNRRILNKIARNARSSWTQAGHLAGRVEKVRARPIVTPTNAAFAMFLGYLEGFRAQRLLATPWAALLDCDPDRILQFVAAASRRGLLDFLCAGGLIEIRFGGLLTREEQGWTHE